MSFSTERSSAPQPLSAKDANNNIGSFYLSNFIESIQQRDYPVFHFDQINNQLVAADAGVKIPELLANSLGFRDLAWIDHASIDSLPVLVLGKNTKQSKVSNGISDALATIEIARKTHEPVDSKKISVVDKLPFYLRITGINKEQNRVVGAKYDLTEGNRLEELNVSLPLDEYFDEENAGTVNIHRLSTRLPTDIKKPYETAGLVTEQMVRHVKKLDDPTQDPEGMFPQMNAIVFSRTSEGFFLGNKLMYVDLKKQSEYALKMGYYVKHEDGNITVELDGFTAAKRGLNSWQITVPEFLPRT